MKVFWILGIISGAIFAIGGIVLGICDIFLIGDGTFLVVGLAFAAIGVLVIILSRKSLKAEAVAEQKLRQTHGDAYVDAIMRKTDKILIRAGIVFLAIMIFVSIPIAISLSNNSHSNSKDKCRNCGRTEDLVPGFGYCEDCYEGFVDWQEDNWK